ncbi:predicted protein [Botrytis cinerea T4]|uniref:Uncharacterized protein n=1 Tax=Botryotinia fuckeliana (strain T4) TaxID=999810 RepID=G2YUG4_BOTF4|nr:predicted protein [Botrytis cinerea T4]
MLYMGYTFSKVYHHFWNGFTIVNLFDSGQQETKGLDFSRVHLPFEQDDPRIIICEL